MDPFKKLMEDHKVFLSMIIELRNTNDPAWRKITAREMVIEINTHMNVEENSLYPYLKAATEGRYLALRSYQEHHIVSVLLKELENTEMEEDNWLAKLEVFEGILSKHIEQEDEEVIPKAKQLLSSDQVKDIENMLKLKQQQSIRSTQ